MSCNKYFGCKDRVGKPYQPSNGTEGMQFMAEFCDRCEKDRKYRKTMDGQYGCEIMANAMCYKQTDPEYPKEWTFTEEGFPVCTAFEEELEPQVRESRKWEQEEWLPGMEDR